MKPTIPTSLLLVAAGLTMLALPCSAQYRTMAPGEILRQAQERQRALDKAGEDLRRNLQEIVDRDQQRRDEERAERQRARDEEAQSRRDREVEQQRQREQSVQEELRRSLEQTLEAERRQQEAISRTLSVSQPTFTAPTPTPVVAVSPARPNSNPEPAAPAAIRPSALGGNPNDGPARKEGWEPYQPVAHNIWISYCKVQEKFDHGKPLWTWSLKNWNDRPVKSLWFEYYDGEKWSTDLVPYSLEPGRSHGGWGSFTASGFSRPPIRITQIEFK